MMHGQKKKSN